MSSSFPRIRRQGLCLAALAFVALGALVLAQHWDDRARLWLQERSTPLVDRLASVWLPGYRAVIQAKALSGLDKDETSGLTYNPVTRTLFTVTGKHPLLVELSLQGEILRRIELKGFANPEGVEVMDNGLMGIVDERRRQLTTFTLKDDDLTLDAAGLAGFDLGFADAGNKGFEGLAYDAQGQRLLVAKERDPVRIFEVLGFPHIDESKPLALQVNTDPKRDARLFVRDLSSLDFDSATGHLLALSDESRLVIELNAAGEPVSTLSLLRGQHGLQHGVPKAEGIASDQAGNLYLISEPNLFYLFRKPAD